MNTGILTGSLEIPEKTKSTFSDGLYSTFYYEWTGSSFRSLLKNSLAGHGPAPQQPQSVDLPLWGGAMPCPNRVPEEFFNNLLN